MALRLHWVPILPSTFSTDIHSPSLILQHKHSSANPFSVSSLFFSNSSISTVSAIPSSTRSRKCRNLAFQISSLAEEQTDSTTTTIETPDTTTSTAITIETPDTTTSEVKDPLKLLAQNIPWSYTATDIRKLFEKHGTVVNVEMSMHNGTRNRGLAFVTMGSEEEAVAALTNLESYEVEGRAIRMAYAFKRKKKIANRPVYPVPSKLKIFVDNLAWNVTTEDLKEFFRSANPVSAEVILERTEPRRSSGYGFVSFGSKEEAAAAISEFKGQPLKGRPIRMELSGRTPKGAIQKVYKRPAQPAETSTEMKVGELEPAQPAETSTEMKVGELEPAQPVETSTKMNPGELSQNVV